jgi:hypothetical protein
MGSKQKHTVEFDPYHEQCLRSAARITGQSLQQCFNQAIVIYSGMAGDKANGKTESLWPLHAIPVQPQDTPRKRRAK